MCLVLLAFRVPPSLCSQQTGEPGDTRPSSASHPGWCSQWPLAFLGASHRVSACGLGTRPDFVPKPPVIAWKRRELPTNPEMFPLPFFALTMRSERGSKRSEPLSRQAGGHWFELSIAPFARCQDYNGKSCRGGHRYSDRFPERSRPSTVIPFAENAFVPSPSQPRIYHLTHLN